MSQPAILSSVQLTGLPDPFTEICIHALHTVRGANFWSRRPITLMEVRIGAYEDISSARARWLTDQLLTALPGLQGHHCSAGRRGGFVQRLHEGTYAAHITEHVALELQSMIGHDTGFGRTRGTGTPAEYSIVIEHRHETVGLRALALALEIVQRAFSGTLQSIDPVLVELRALAQTPDTAPLRHRVLCGITGSAARAETRDAIAALRTGIHAAEQLPLVDVAPAYLLHAGLPYAEADFAVILDTSPIDVPARYREPERATRLVSIVADAVPPGGLVICPSNAHRLHDIIRGAGRSVHGFVTSDDVTITAARVAGVVDQVVPRCVTR